MSTLLPHPPSSLLPLFRGWGLTCPYPNTPAPLQRCVRTPLVVLIVCQTHTMWIAGECCLACVSRQPLFLPWWAFRTNKRHSVLCELLRCHYDSLRSFAGHGSPSLFSFFFFPPNALVYEVIITVRILLRMSLTPTRTQLCQQYPWWCMTCASFDNELCCHNKVAFFF